MRSDTLVSLFTFGDFLGIDPYLLAQVDYTGDNSTRLKEGWCEVFVEYEWQSIPDPNQGAMMGFLSRQTLTRALQHAEQLFGLWTGRHPAPEQVSDEYHAYAPRAYRPQSKLYSIKPLNQPVMAPGTWVSTALVANPVTLDRSNLDWFTVDVTVPAGTRADDIHVYLTETDGEYSGTPDLQHEIRPLTVTVSGTTATISGPAYLFVLPSLYEEREPARLAHTLATYVSQVDIYSRSVDQCGHGDYVFTETSLTLLPESTRSLYLTLEKSRHHDYVIPHPIECDEGDELTRYALTKTPGGFQINYISGYSGKTRLIIQSIICKMATALLDFDFTDTEWDRRYGCNGLFIPRVRLYQDIPATRTKEATRLASGQYTGATYQTLVPQHIIDRLNGLTPMKGIVDAYHQCLNLGIMRF